MSDTVYGPTRNFATTPQRFGVSTTFFDRSQGLPSNR